MGVPTFNFENKGFEAKQIAPQQVLTYPTYLGLYGYVPMFIEIIFLMLFLMLPLLMIIPLFKSLSKAFAG